jgi:hypothetical protein
VVAPNDEKWLTAAQVRARQGSITNMTLWRWTRDPALAFPPPDDRRNNRKFWKLSTIVRWENARADAAKQAEAA